MEKWQVCSIFSVAPRPRLALPNHLNNTWQQHLEGAGPGGFRIMAWLKAAGQKIAEFVAMF